MGNTMDFDAMDTGIQDNCNIPGSIPWIQDYPGTHVGIID
jgi:hypothetical protein